MFVVNTPKPTRGGTRCIYNPTEKSFLPKKEFDSFGGKKEENILSTLKSTSIVIPSQKPCDLDPKVNKSDLALEWFASYR